MIKILNFMLFSIVMIIDVISTLFAHLLGLVFLICNELIGSKQFIIKFKKLTKGLINQIKVTLKDYKSLIARV